MLVQPSIWSQHNSSANFRISFQKEASALDGLFTFVPEIYVNILPILLDTIMDFSFHDIADQYDQSGKYKKMKFKTESIANESPSQITSTYWNWAHHFSPNIPVIVVWF